MKKPKAKPPEVTDDVRNETLRNVRTILREHHIDGHYVPQRINMRRERTVQYVYEQLGAALTEDELKALLAELNKEHRDLLDLFEERAGRLREAYEQIQKLPTWSGMPAGEAENKLRAVEALARGTILPEQAWGKLQAIRTLLGAHPLVTPGEEMAEALVQKAYSHPVEPGETHPAAAMNIKVATGAEPIPVPEGASLSAKEAEDIGEALLEATGYGLQEPTKGGGDGDPPF